MPMAIPAKDNKNCLSYWFPLIRDAGLPVPKTEIVTIKDEFLESVGQWAMDCQPTPVIPFWRDMVQAVEKIGAPCFLRTGQGSGKHEWDRCCNLRDVGQIASHVAALINWSECVDMIGLPWNVWAVREMLPVTPYGVCPLYGNMPIVREFRCFVDGGRLLWRNPYWPKDSLEQGGAVLFDSEYDDLCACPQQSLVENLASAAGKAVGGLWSVDVLETDRGWYVTDMAIAERSYGWDQERYESFGDKS